VAIPGNPGTATSQKQSHAAIGFNTPSSGADPDANEVLARRPLARQLPGPGRPPRRARPPPRWVGNSRTDRDAPRGRNLPRPEHRNLRGRVIPKLEDPDSCYVRRRWDIHCKNVRWSNGIWAHCSGADGGADESMSPQFGIMRQMRHRKHFCAHLLGVLEDGVVQSP